MGDMISEVALDMLAMTVADKLTQGASTKNDPALEELNRQLTQARKVNNSLCAYLKEVHNLTDEQIVKAQSYQAKAPKRLTPKACPHCKQRIFSRNIATCSTCGNSLGLNSTKV